MCSAVFQNLERLVDCDPRGENPGDLGGIELLEPVDLTRLGTSFELCKSGELDKLAAGTADMDLPKGVRIEAVLAL